MDWREKAATQLNKVSKEDAAKELSTYLDRYEWFYDCVIEGNAICVYVEHMSKEVLDKMPTTIYNYQVKEGFAQYLRCGDKYGKQSAIPLEVFLAGTNNKTVLN